ncbi:uncharacterized protein LOC126858804 [Cataglyphis hispanica]|uniref:uncharacterized protein LOC126858804 n=1 Tax=Cataglyphis hispanica TaxID=1086592 RepID=UPI0021805E62|nr:uncharacterized protein LOC126858804 [Cataglyphis hispanica]
MKTFVLMTCLLTFSYAINPQVVKKVYDDLSSCFKELNVQNFTPETVKCYIQKNDLLDEQLRLKKEENFAIWDDIISDPNLLSQIKTKISDCMDQAYRGVKGNEKNEYMMFIQCIMPLANVFDLKKIVSR